MKYSFIFLVIILFCSCHNRKNVLVVYPEYCGGCVIRNFSELKNKKLADKFTVYFDTTNTFILNCATQNKLNFQHIYNKDIPAKFGDYANVVVINLDGKTIELKTNETITKGVHF